MTKKSGVWRGCLSDLLLLAGMMLLLGAALIWARSVLAAQESANHRYLAASVPLALPLPDQASSVPLVSGLPSPTPESPKNQALAATQAAVILQETEPEPQSSPMQQQTVTSELLSEAQVVSATPPPDMTAAVPTGTPTPFPVVEASPSPFATEMPPASNMPTANATPVATELTPSNPVVYLEIPRLKVKRAVVPIGMRPERSGGMSWDTDAIFATNNRPDLVGHLVGSAYPGQGGNIILVGHNYNQVDYGWEGVFVAIKTLQAGDRILIRGEDGREYFYVVQQVKQVPWRSQSAKELEKHLKFLGPVKSERLTLVTCGGANIWPFPARVYVIAIPETP